MYMYCTCTCTFGTLSVEITCCSLNAGHELKQHIIQDSGDNVVIRIRARVAIYLVYYLGVYLSNHCG
jgi:hypothetical protein